MATWYRSGTVSVANNSANVVGAGTLWASQVSVGDVFTIDGTKLYEIASIADDTHLALYAAYTGATASGASYGIIRNFTGTTQAGLAAQLAALLNSWQTRESQYSAWQPGTATGGVNGDGRYPITDALGNTYNYYCPAKLEQLGGGGGNVATDVIWDARGDLPVGTGPNAAIRLAVGTNGQALVADSTTASGLKWAAVSGGSGSVATDTIWDAKGDLAVGTTADTAVRLGIGTTGQVLTVDPATGTGVKWATPTGGGSATAYGANPPASPAELAAWIDSADGTQYFYINDGTSSQWVELGNHV